MYEGAAPLSPKRTCLQLGYRSCVGLGFVRTILVSPTPGGLYERCIGFVSRVVSGIRRMSSVSSFFKEVLRRMGEKVEMKLEFTTLSKHHSV